MFDPNSFMNIGQPQPQGPAAYATPTGQPQQSPFGQMTPEETAALGGAVNVDPQSKILEEQIAQAQALRGNHQHHITTLGGALGGLGDMLNTYTSKRDEKGFRGQQQEGLAKQRAAYDAVIAAMRRTQQPAAQPAAPSMDGIPPMLRNPAAGGQ